MAENFKDQLKALRDFAKGLQHGLDLPLVVGEPLAQHVLPVVRAPDEPALDLGRRRRGRQRCISEAAQGAFPGLFWQRFFGRMAAAAA